MKPSEAFKWWESLTPELKRQNVTMFMDRTVLWYDITEEEIISLYNQIKRHLL